MVKAGYSKTGSLTRVLHERLRGRCGDNSKVKEWNEQHHFGVERTLPLAHQVEPTVTRKEVKDIV